MTDGNPSYVVYIDPPPEKGGKWKAKVFRGVNGQHVGDEDAKQRVFWRNLESRIQTDLDGMSLEDRRVRRRGEDPEEKERGAYEDVRDEEEVEEPI